MKHITLMLVEKDLYVGSNRKYSKNIESPFGTDVVAIMRTDNTWEHVERITITRKYKPTHLLSKTCIPHKKFNQCDVVEGEIRIIDVLPKFKLHMCDASKSVNNVFSILLNLLMHLRELENIPSGAAKLDLKAFQPNVTKRYD